MFVGGKIVWSSEIGFPNFIVEKLEQNGWILNMHVASFKHVTFTFKRAVFKGITHKGKYCMT